MRLTSRMKLSAIFLTFEIATDENKIKTKQTSLPD
jgi:hypothetical protein